MRLLTSVCLWRVSEILHSTAARDLKQNVDLQNIFLHWHQMLHVWTSHIFTLRSLIALWYNNTPTGLRDTCCHTILLYLYIFYFFSNEINYLSPPRGLPLSVSLISSYLFAFFGSDEKKKKNVIPNNIYT